MLKGALKSVKKSLDTAAGLLNSTDGELFIEALEEDLDVSFAEQATAQAISVKARSEYEESEAGLAPRIAAAEEEKDYSLLSKLVESRSVATLKLVDAMGEFEHARERMSVIRRRLAMLTGARSAIKEAAKVLEKLHA